MWKEKPLELRNRRVAGFMKPIRLQLLWQIPAFLIGTLLTGFLTAEEEPGILLGSASAKHVLVFKNILRHSQKWDDYAAKVDSSRFVRLKDMIGDSGISEVEPFLVLAPYVLVAVGADGKSFEAWKIYPSSRPRNAVCKVSIEASDEGFTIGDSIPEPFTGYVIDEQFNVIEFLDSLIKDHPK